MPSLLEGFSSPVWTGYWVLVCVMTSLSGECGQWGQSWNWEWGGDGEKQLLLQRELCSSGAVPFLS